VLFNAFKRVQAAVLKKAESKVIAQKTYPACALPQLCTQKTYFWKRNADRGN
jgi:hypothetical protein